MKRSPAPAPAILAELSWTGRGTPWILAVLVAVYVARPLWPSESASRAGDGLPIVILTLLLCAAWWGLGLLDGKRSIRWHPLDTAVGLLIAAFTVSSIASASHDHARPAINMLWEWVGMGLAYWLARQCVGTNGEARTVFAVMIALAVACSSLGLYQYFVSLPATRAEYAANPDAVLRQEGMWFPPGSVERELFEQRLASTEPLATFALTNSLAGFLATWMVVMGGAMLATRPGKHWLGWLTAAAGSLVVCATCLLLTKSRSGYAAVVVGFAACALWSGGLQWPTRRLIALVTVATLLLVILLAVAGGVDWEVIAEAPKSLGYRWQYWQATLAMIREHPWLGVGPGNFADHYTRFKLPTASEEISDPHNFLLELWATGGAVALVAMLILVVGLVRVLLRQIHEPSEGASNSGAEQSAIGPAALGGALGFLLAAVLSAALPMLLEVPLHPTTALAEFVIAAATFQGWRAWIRSGVVPKWLPATAALALLLNLSAAGGIGYPAVAGSLWLLLAITINLGADERISVLGKGGALVGWSAALALLAACFISAYQPVLAAQRYMSASAQAFQAGNVERAETDLESAARADRFSAAPWVALADLHLRRWRDSATTDRFEAYEQAMLTALRKRPQQAALWLRLADGYLEGYRTLEHTPLLAKAVDCYRQAVRLYPSHARERGKLAVALFYAGNVKEAQQEARFAAELDAITPHHDQKMRPELRHELIRLGLMKSTPTS